MSRKINMQMRQVHDTSECTVWHVGASLQPSVFGRLIIASWKTARPMTDWSDCIIAIAKERDQRKFADLFAYFGPRLKSFFMRLGVTASIAEDLMQETMLIVWRKADRFDPARARASTWIFTIARNLRIDLKRRERDPQLLAEFYEGSHQPTPSDVLLSAERDERVQHALATLPFDQAQVICLSFFEDRPHSQIASDLKIPLGTVKSRMRLAVTRLRALVEEQQ